MKTLSNRIRLRCSRAVAMLFALPFCLVGGYHASAEEIKVGSLTVSQAWSRATPKGAKVGAGYLKITNLGSNIDRLVEAKSVMAGRVEIHTMKMDNGVMKMRRLANGVELPAGKTVELKPGGRHLMFMGLTEGFKKGHPFKVTLVFERAGKLELEFGVEAIGAMAPTSDKSGSHGHGAHTKTK